MNYGKRHILKGIPLLWAGLLLGSCASGFSARVPVVEYNLLAIYQLSGEKYPDSSKIRKELKPLKKFPDISPEKLKDLLGVLKYRKDSLWGASVRNVFYPGELDYMVPIVSRALQKLPAGDRLVVVTRYDPDQSVLSRMERVSFIIWADGDGINILLGEIREEISHNDQLSYDEWTRILPISMKHSYPDLALVRSEIFSLKEVNGNVHNTWAVFPEDKLDAVHYVAPVEEKAAAEKKEEPDSNRPDMPSSGNRDSGSSVNLTAKLKDLKSALDSGLITKEEYEKKRKEILDRY